MFIILVSDDFREVVPALLPFYHIYGLLSLAIASLHLGSKVITVPKFEPEHFISTVVKNKVSNTAVFMPFLILLFFKLET
jgi:acyl-CoA synthetase (AMP-forming)/AMP-acid ligase II